MWDVHIVAPSYSCPSMRQPLRLHLRFRAGTQVCRTIFPSLLVAAGDRPCSILVFRIFTSAFVGQVAAARKDPEIYAVWTAGQKDIPDANRLDRRRSTSFCSSLRMSLLTIARKKEKESRVVCCVGLRRRTLLIVCCQTSHQWSQNGIGFSLAIVTTKLLHSTKSSGTSLCVVCSEGETLPICGRNTHPFTHIGSLHSIHPCGNSWLSISFSSISSDLARTK